ncbi:MAG: endonuclease/exonuclease/phosphatase family protein [Patescibacteria group bacterium]
MIIISWNLCVENNNQIQSVYNLLKDYQPDVVCLQEVSLSCLKDLQLLKNYELIVAKDFNSFKYNKKREYKLVILSKYQILNRNGDNKFSISHLTRRSFWDFVNRWQESLEFQFIDIEYRNQRYRIFNIHLEVAAGPRLRLKQFMFAARHFNPKAHNIVCGDLNIYAKFWLNLLVGWAMGYTPTELFINEEKLFESEFRRLGMMNLFKGQKTYPKYGLQLDYILVPNSLSTKNNQIITSVKDSDHYAIVTTLN